MRISTASLAYAPQTRSWVADISNFATPQQVAAMHETDMCWSRMYPDACDVGIILVNARTGHEAKYVMSYKRHERGAGEDAEITEFVCEPLPETLRKYPQLRGTKVILFND